jgi:hypothetical protein
VSSAMKGGVRGGVHGMAKGTAKGAMRRTLGPGTAPPSVGVHRKRAGGCHRG